MSPRRLVWLGAALFCLLASGCTQESTQGDASIFTYQIWVGFVAIMVGALVTFYGWTQRGESWKGWLAFGIGALATVFFCPFAFFDKVHLDNQKLETRWGFWTFPTRHDIALDNISTVTLTKKTSSGRRGRRTSYYLNFNLKNGQTEQLTANNSLMEAAADKLIASLQARNIPIIDNTGD